jgi:hypothetical protein
LALICVRRLQTQLEQLNKEYEEAAAGLLRSKNLTVYFVISSLTWGWIIFFILNFHLISPIFLYFLKRVRSLPSIGLKGTNKRRVRVLLVISLFIYFLVYYLVCFALIFKMVLISLQIN